MNRAKNAKKNYTFFRRQAIREVVKNPKTTLTFGVGVNEHKAILVKRELREVDQALEDQQNTEEVKIITSEMLLSTNGRKLGGAAKLARIRKLEEEGYINSFNL
jgi:hypothetical protein